jgi:uncharacterized protein (TIGR00645 family)
MLEHYLEKTMFASRWLLAPFYLGLVFGIVLLLMAFGVEFAHLATDVLTGKGSVVIGILLLVDLTLLANLLIIIIFAGYENFVSKINVGDHEDKPEWMGHVDFTDLKMKLIGSIIAISGIDLLKSFVNVENYTNEQLAWKVGIHCTFLLSGLIFAIMDRLSVAKKSMGISH